MASGIASSQVLAQLLLALAAILLTVRLIAPLFGWIGQPPVMGEIVAGIALGPSILGAVWPQAGAFVLPPEILPHLGVVSQIGVILFMFCVGVELDTSQLRGRARSAIAISNASVIVPFLSGVALAVPLHPLLAPGGVPFTVFALFLGTAMSVTAFPVLARILKDQRMTETALGATALTCAAVDDVTAWCLLAVAVGVADHEARGPLLTIGLTVGYLVVMVTVVRPVARAVARRTDGALTGPATVSWILLAVVASALVTEWIGIHPIFGAFVLGALFPHDSALAREVKARIETLVTVLFLPVFFAYSGLRTRFGLIHGTDEWLLCIAIILVASIGKFAGSYGAGRLTGMTSREAATIGVLLNTRGLVELIVLNVGLDLGVISPTLFTMLVLMALATTLAATPLLRLLARPAAAR